MQFLVKVGSWLAFGPENDHGPTESAHKFLLSLSPPILQKRRTGSKRILIDSDGINKALGGMAMVPGTA